MDGVREHVTKLIGLVSGRERRNPAVKRIIFRIERLMLWINESIHADTNSNKLNGRDTNGKRSISR